MATPQETDAVLQLYREQIGQEYCFWDEEYPGLDTIEADLARQGLFVMKNGEGEIIAAISVEEDADVDRLDCWTSALQPGGEFARLAVKPALQNRGFAQQMVTHVLDVLKQRGFKSVHILVNRENVKAIRSYAHIGFRVVGECFLYQQHFLCYEKPLEFGENSFEQGPQENA